MLCGFRAARAGHYSWEGFEREEAGSDEDEERESGEPENVVEWKFVRWRSTAGRRCLKT